jgi:hypothetical protein
MGKRFGGKYGRKHFDGKYGRKRRKLDGAKATAGTKQGDD